nr:hypothetical protein [Tanacetum cinerariifolium]
MVQVKRHAISRMHQPRFNFVFDFATIDQDHELGFAHSEIKLLKATDVLKDKSLDEMANMAAKLDEKLRTTKNLLEQKNLDIKKLITKKKEAFAVEATLRRISALQEDKKTLERHTKSKEEALLESERILKSLWAFRSKVADEDEKESNERILKNAGVKNDNIRESDVLPMMVWFSGFCMIPSKRSDWFKEVLQDERKQLECKRR